MELKKITAPLDPDILTPGLSLCCLSLAITLGSSRVLYQCTQCKRPTDLKKDAALDLNGLVVIPSKLNIN